MKPLSLCALALIVLGGGDDGPTLRAQLWEAFLARLESSVTVLGSPFHFFLSLLQHVT